MAKTQKEYIAVSLRMEKRVYEKLEKFIEDTGLSKTKSIEKAVEKYVDEYFMNNHKI